MVGRYHTIKFETPIPCPYCGEPMKSNMALARHVLREHNFSNPNRKEFSDDELAKTA